MHIIIGIILFIFGIASCESCKDAEVARESARAEAAERQRQAQYEAYQRQVAERQRKEEEARKQQALKRSQYSALQEFAQKEMPRAWSTYQEICVLIDERTKRINDLETTLELLRPGSSKADRDLLELKAKVEEIKQLKNSIYTSIEDAYISAVKFSAEFGSAEEKNFKASMDAAKRNSDAVIERFNVMRKLK